MKEALTIAANAHGLHTNGSLENHEPLLSHQGCVCADTALPVITLPRQNSGGLENQVLNLLGNFWTQGTEASYSKGLRPVHEPKMNEIKALNCSNVLK